MRPLFGQERVAASANAFLDGLLGESKGTRSGQLAALTGDA
jgi:hypothetical protein